MRSEYFWRIRSASALRFSNGCSSLNLLLMFAVLGGGRRKRVVMLVAVRDVCTKSNEGRTSAEGS